MIASLRFASSCNTFIYDPTPYACRRDILLSHRVLPSTVALCALLCFSRPNVIGCHEFPDQVMGVNNCICMTLEYDWELVKQDRRRQPQAPEWPSSNG
jgi:hypothetical protein